MRIAAYGSRGVDDAVRVLNATVGKQSLTFGKALHAGGMDVAERGHSVSVGYGRWTSQTGERCSLDGSLREQRSERTGGKCDDCGEQGREGYFAENVAHRTPQDTPGAECSVGGDVA